ncbi:MAG: V-type ATP synthase subunit I, partial [Chlamydiae bacterium]|nr:V-type ATP synthase subunit I [Chlamydiota bacterium]
MIIKMHKYLLYGSQSELDRFFEKAQQAGFLEFIGLSHKKALELPEEAKTILSAIKIAKHHFLHPNKEILLDPLKIAEAIIALQANLEGLLEEKRMLAAEIARISVFGDFSKQEIAQIEHDAKRVVQFFCMKSDLAREISLPQEFIYVGTEYDLDYFVAIHKEKITVPKMIEIHIDRPVGVLKQRLKEVHASLSQCEADLRAHCNALPTLQNGLNNCLNEYTLRLAKHDASIPLHEALFAIEAWVPRNRIKTLHGLLSSLHVHS